MADNAQFAYGFVTEEKREKIDSSRPSENVIVEVEIVDDMEIATTSEQQINNDTSDALSATTAPLPRVRTGEPIPRPSSRRIPTRDYLNQTVVPILLKGIEAIIMERPENPSEFLGNFLLREKDHFSPAQNSSK